MVVAYDEFPETGKAPSIGERIRERRMAKGWAFDRLARETGLSRGTLWEAEKKHERVPLHETLEKIADALDVSVDYLRTGRMSVGESSLADFPPEAYGRARGIKNPRHLHLIGELFAEFEQQREHD